MAVHCHGCGVTLTPEQEEAIRYSDETPGTAPKPVSARVPIPPPSSSPAAAARKVRLRLHRADEGVEVEATPERVSAGDILPGHFVARSRGEAFMCVSSLVKGPRAVRLLDSRGATIARPRHAASWWRVTMRHPEAA
jgi:hypothetical protein